MPSTLALDTGSQIVLPPGDATDQADISKLLDDFADYLDLHGGQARLTSPDGVSTPIPPQVYKVLEAAVRALSHGVAVTITPMSMRLTTSQAAEILGISRPTLVRLLNDGLIPYEQPRRHRLLRLVDVLDFQKRQRAKRRLVLDEMTQEAVKVGLYKTTSGDYTEALAETRRSTGRVHSEALAGTGDVTN